jgi:hypothetical protein
MTTVAEPEQFSDVLLSPEDLDLEYGHPVGEQAEIRAEAFMEMLESRAGAAV